MPLPEPSTPEPGDLNPLTDVLYLEEGKIKKIVPKHPETKPMELLMAASAAIHVLGEVLYGNKGKFQLKHQPAWGECLIGEIANELQISHEVLMALLVQAHNKDFILQHLNTDGFRVWGLKHGLDESHPFLERGLAEIKAWYESKNPAEPFSREDRPPRSFGNG